MTADPATAAEADRIAQILLASACEIGALSRTITGPAERLRWRRVQHILATAGAEIGLPDVFDPPPPRVNEVGH